MPLDETLALMELMDRIRARWGARLPDREMSPMEYGQPAWSDRKVSRIVQGTIMLRAEEQEEGFEFLDAVWASGINAFDTAALYGGGTCERILGRWLEDRGLRDQAFVLGKSCHHNADRRRVTPFDIASDIADSLARQRHGYHDLHCLHRDDPQVPVGPIVEALNEHLDAGRIRAFGGSNWTTARLEEANEYAEARGLRELRGLEPQLQPRRREGGALGGLPEHLGTRRGRQTGSGTLRGGCRCSPGRAWPAGFFSGLLTRANAESLREEVDASSVSSYWHEDNWRRLDRVDGAGRRAGLHRAPGGPRLGAAEPGPGRVRPRGRPHRRRVPGQRRGLRPAADGGGDGVAGPAARGAVMSGCSHSQGCPAGA